ncbi:hypothetical protein [Leucobacter aridicollis]|uniref:hypothetical protein n=1 Tax=Leucobacter aridicollis TaxID=283878 RepID=UPI0013C453B9|nr:hypothetical protein [Leucobacter aridicollis]UTX53596.1 hypothetical protein KI794_02270 [Leucobacter aridicollis]
MSEQHAPQPAPQGVDLNAAQALAGAEPGKKKLSMFLRVSIILLIGLTLASISLLFIGDFEGRFERIFSTFALFAVFVVLTAIDTSRDRANEWYAPVALIANTYILGLLLVVIWMTPYDSFSLMFQIFWKSFLVILVTRLVILCCELLLRSGKDDDEAGNRFAFITSVLAVLSGILFTAPVGIEAFSLHVPDMYWKIATAVLILTALGLSVTLLLRWANNSEERSARREADKAAQRAAAIAAPASVAGGAEATIAAQTAPTAESSQVAPPLPQAANEPQAVAPQSPPAPHSGQAPTEVLLPWPTFADGRPIPARPDGQPDFSVPGAPLPPTF